MAAQFGILHVETLKKSPNYKKFEIRKCCLMYKRNNGPTPSYLQNILVRNADIHSKLTRHCNVNFVCPRYKRDSEGGRTFQV